MTTTTLSLDEVRKAQEQTDAIRREVRRIYVGDADPVDRMLVALLARGHALLEGVPGVAKTTLVKAFGASLGCSIRRIQFTPDLLPADITGTYVLNPRDGSFAMRPGPVFANVVLADEINRAPAKTQSALLEAMQERQVTVEGERHELPDPFFVLATQNPVDLEGTYTLPEAQIDRFLVRVRMTYPSTRDEIAMLEAHGVDAPEPARVVDAATVLDLQKTASRVHVESDVLEYAVALTTHTRGHESVVLGASPRASLALLRAGKSHAVINGRHYATPDDLRAVAESVLAHRLVLLPELEADLDARTQVVEETVARVPYRKAAHAR